MTGKTYVIYILDKSSSMNQIRQQAIDGFNDNLYTARTQSRKHKHIVKGSLITFNENVSFDIWNTGIFKIPQLTLATYIPSGWTAMHDAVGFAIEKAKRDFFDLKMKDTAVLFVIVSDGEENSSRNYNASSLAKMIREVQATEKWTFTYLGAEQDLSKVADETHIPLGNTRAFMRTIDGYSAASIAVSSGVTTYFNERAKGVTFVSNFYSGT